MKFFADAGYGNSSGTNSRDDRAPKNRDRRKIRRGGLFVLPKPCVAERTFAWISRNRLLIRNFERYATRGVTFILRVMICLVLKKFMRASASS
jgi:hypothetical protein